MIRPLFVLMLLLGLPAVISCRSDRITSPAADAFIEQAETAEERQALTEAREEIDREQAEQVAELDAEIEALRLENDALRRTLDAQ